MARRSLRPLSAPRLDSRASDAAFGGGRSLESFGGGAGPEAYGAGLKIPNATPLAYGAGLARDLQYAGQIVSDAAEVAIRIDRQDRIISSRRKALSARTEYGQRFQELKAGVSADARDFTKNTMADYDEFRRQKLEGLSGIERETVEAELLDFEGSVYGKAVEFETERKFEYRKTEAASLTAIAQNAVFSSPEDLGSIRKGVVDTINASELPQFAKDALVQTATANLAESYWLANVQRDPYGAKAALESGQDLQGLEFSSRATLLNKADTEIRGIEVERRRAAAEAAAEARARAAEARQAQALRLSGLREETQFAVQMIGQGLPVAGIGDLAKRIAAEGEAGSKLGEALNLVQDTADFSRTFAMIPVAEQAAEIEALRTQPQTEETFAKLGAAAKVLGATSEAIRENRALQRAAELGVIDLQPVDFTDPQSVANRIGAARMASDYLGGPVEMFTPAERAAQAQVLAGMRGEQKAQYLATIQEAAGDAYPDVIRELGLKGGLDRGSRYLSLLAGRPEAALIANAVGEAMDTDPKDLKVNLDRAQVSEAEVDRMVADELEDFLTTLGPTYAQGSGGGAQAMIADLSDMVKRTALVQMRTMSASEAVRQAADAIINSRYEFRDGYRIPRPSVGGDAAVARIDQMMDEAMAALTPELVDPPGSLMGVDEATRRNGYVEAVRNRGQWATLPDESGLVLLDENANAVTVKGRPVVVKF